MELHLDLQCKHSVNKQSTQMKVELTTGWLDLSLCEECLFELAEKSKRPRSWVNLDIDDLNKLSVSQGGSKYERDKMESPKFTPNCY